MATPISTPIIRKPRLAHLIHFDGPGGGPKSVARQIRFFKDEYAITAIHGGHGEIASLCEQLQVPHIQLPLDRFLKLPIGFFRLILTLRRIRPDILLLHGQWAAPLGAIAGKLARIPHIVYIARWPAFYTTWDTWRAMRNDIAERIPCRLAEKVVALSNSSRYHYLYRHMAQANKIAVIPNPLEQDVLPTSEKITLLRQRHGWASDKIHVVSVGRLSTQKRVDWLLRSWRLVMDSGLNARLWIIGDGELKEDLMRLARELSLGDACVFLGAQPQGIPFIAAADIVAMTSLYESFGNVVLEAFVCGKPIVASRVDGIRDTLTDGAQGYLVMSGDVNTFADRLMELIRNPSMRARMGEEGRKAALAYRPDLVFRQYRELFDSLLGSKP